MTDVTYDIGLDALQAGLPSAAEAEAAFAARARESETDAALQWLNDFAGASPQQPQAASGAAPATKAAPAPASPPDASGGVWDTVKGVGRDLARGATEAPRQILGGMRDAVQSAIDLGDWVADNLERLAPLGGVQLFDDAGGFAPGYIPAGDPRLAQGKTGGALPKVKDAQSVTGGVVRSVAQFLTGFAGAGVAMGGALAGAPLARAAVQGGLADATAFGAHDQRLSNLIEQVPALKNPVSAYLAADPSDGEVEGRLKNALEGLALGGVTEGVFRAIRYVRDTRRAKAGSDPAQAAARAAAAPPEAKAFDLLGDESRPMLEMEAAPPAKPDPTADIGVPSDVAARGVAGRAEDVRRGVLKMPDRADAEPASGAASRQDLEAIVKDLEREEKAAGALPETRGQGVQFHGTAAAEPVLDDFHSSTMNYYGSGLYTTDALDVAEGYSRKGARKGQPGSIFAVAPKRPLNILDGEAPLSPDLIARIRGVEDPVVRQALEANPSSLRAFYDAIRNDATTDGVSANEIQDVFDSVRYHLEVAGYDGFSHAGGRQTKAAAHKVVVYFNPASDLEIVPAPAFAEARGRQAKARERLAKARQDLAGAPADQGDLRGRLRQAYAGATEGAPSSAGRITIGDVSAEGAADINALLKAAGVDLDVSGYRHEADAYAARHAVKQHGDATRELPRGQLPVEADDWASIPDILAAPDRVEYAGKTKQGRDAIGYWKQVNGHVVYVEEVRTGRGTLAATTMRKFKGKLEEVVPGRPDGDAPQSYVRNALPGGDTVVQPSIRINFARIDSADDVKVVMADMADAFGEDIGAARRGVQTNAQTAEAAGDIDAWNLISARREGQPWNAEEALAARRMWEASGAKLMEVAQAAASQASPENLFQFRKMMAIHHAVQREVIAARTETARALQSWRIPAGGGGAERLRAIENVLLTHGGAETAEVMARRVAALGRLSGGRAMLDDVVEKGAFAKSLDTVKEVWINALLSNPKTHAVNMIGNGLTVGLSMLERAGAAGWSQAIGSGDILPGEAAAHAFGLSQGIRDGFRMFWQALREGESQFGASTTKAEQGFERAISSTNWKLDPDNWLGKAVDGLGFLVNLPTRFLGAEDDFFKSIGYRMEVNAQAFRQAAREVQDGALAREGMKARAAELAASPPESIRLAATDAALYQTFTSRPGRLVQSIGILDRQWQQGSAGEKLSAFAMRMLIPFRNTPANIVRYAFERTPMAPLMSRYREAVAQGGAAADLARTRMALGTFTLLGVMDLALDGQVSGGGPRGDRHRGDREALQRSGWQPYSVKVGDRWVSYARTDPVGLTLGIAADIAEIVSNAELDAATADDLFEVVAGAAASFGNQILDKSYMSGLSGFMDALHNPNKAAGFVERLAAGFVPAAVNEARRQADPYMRFTRDLTTQLANRTPGLSEDLPVARDFWGRPRTYQSGLGTLYDAVSPLAARTFDPAPIDREAIAEGFNLSMPDWELGGVKLRNRPEVYSRLLEVRGGMKPSQMGGKDGARLAKKYGDMPLLPLLNAIVDGKHSLSERYAGATGGAGGGKDDMVTGIVRAYTKAARGKVRAEFPEIFK